MTVRQWLETVPDFSEPRDGGRTITDGLSVTERLALLAIADFETLSGGQANPTLERLSTSLGRSRRQTIRIVKALRDDLGLIRIVRASRQHEPNVYAINLPREGVGR